MMDGAYLGVELLHGPSTNSYSRLHSVSVCKFFKERCPFKTLHSQRNVYLSQHLNKEESPNGGAKGLLIAALRRGKADVAGPFFLFRGLG